MSASQLGSLLIASQKAASFLKHAYFDSWAVIQLLLKPYLCFRLLPISSSIRPVQFDHSTDWTAWQSSLSDPLRD